MVDAAFGSIKEKLDDPDWDPLKELLQKAESPAEVPPAQPKTVEQKRQEALRKLGVMFKSGPYTKESNVGDSGFFRFGNVRVQFSKSLIMGLCHNDGPMDFFTRDEIRELEIILCERFRKDRQLISDNEVERILTEFLK